MKINIKKPKTIHLKDVPNGDLFMLNDRDLYFKTEYTDTRGYYKCYSVRNGALSHFCGSNNVIKVKSIEVEVEE